MGEDLLPNSYCQHATHAWLTAGPTAVLCCAALSPAPSLPCRHRILKEGCVGADGRRRLVLDVGASFGYYTLLAASLGCR